MNAVRKEISIEPSMQFPPDDGLPDLLWLFDGEWVWRKYSGQFGIAGLEPHRILIKGVSHVQLREAVVSYEIEWPEDAYLPNDRFTFLMRRGDPLRINRFPDDDHLPGLAKACDPESALRLVGRYVMAIPPRRMRVQVIRYRPRSHAVLRHRMGKSRLYARVVRPSAVPAILKSGELIGRSDFAVPRLAGLWREGGVLWFSEIPGTNLRRLLRKGEQPSSAPILDGLESLWAVPPGVSDAPPFNLPGAYQRAKQIIGHSVRQGDGGWPEFRHAVQVLDDFTGQWRTTGTAHNDFYDDQMVMLPGGKIALVDIEGAGPGDPMLDVGNFLAHLRWSSEVSRRGQTFGEYHDTFRRAAFDRFGWHEDDLKLREAVCLFRICTNAVRHPGEDWRQRLVNGVSLVTRTLA